MMDIIHIVPGKANPNTLNGVNKVVDAIATEQVKLCQRTMVVGVANNTEKRHNPTYEYQLFVKSRIPFCAPKGLLDFLLKNSTPDTVFHFHSVFIFWYLPLIKALKKANRRRLFLTPHGQYVDEAMRSTKKRIAFSLFDSKVIREVEAVHIIGYKTEHNAFVKENAQRVVFVPNGFGCQQPQVHKRSEELVFGYLGRLECRQKGLDLLIPAFINYKKNGGKGILRIAGTGPDELLLKRMVQENKMSENIIFDGVLYNEDKWKFLYNCTAFVHPSRWDVFPTACLEAAYTGCPLLVSEETNMRLTLEKYNSGMCISPLDIPSIEKQLSSFSDCFCNKETYVSMQTNARKMVEEELNWTSITQNIITNLYKN